MTLQMHRRTLCSIPTCLEITGSSGVIPLIAQVNDIGRSVGRCYEPNAQHAKAIAHNLAIKSAEATIAQRSIF
jgi:hypothetical protein